jgi:chromosome partitioning protein
MGMPKIIAVANPKGGVGKTTSTLNLGVSLAIAEKRVLLIDLDPNGALSLGLGISTEDTRQGIYEILLGTTDITDCIQRTDLSNLDIIPCNISSHERELRISTMAKNRSVLKRKLNDLIAKKKLHYDFILIDTPPSLGDLTLVALFAAHSVLIPLQCSYFAINIVSRLLQVIKRLRDSGNPDLQIEGILLNFYEKNTKASQRGAQDARQLFSDQVMQTIIPKNSMISYAAFEKKAVAMVDISAPGSLAYLALAEEILRKNSEEPLPDIKQAETPHEIIPDQPALDPLQNSSVS